MDCYSQWKTDSPDRISSRHFENKCYRTFYCKKLWHNAVPIDLAVTYTDFHVHVIKKDHIIFPCLLIKKLFNYSKIVRKWEWNTERNVTTFKNVKKNLKKTVEDLQDALKTACQKFSIQENTMELLMASASQIPGEIFQRIGKKHKIQYRIEPPGSKNICINLTPLLGACLQVS